MRFHTLSWRMYCTFVVMYVMLLSSSISDAARTTPPQASLSVMDFNLTECHIHEYNWTVTKDLQSVNTTTATFVITVNKTDTWTNTLKVAGFLVITNSGDGTATLGNIVLNLQKSFHSIGFKSICSDVSNEFFDDAATEGRVVAGAVSETGVCSFLNSNECRISENRCHHTPLVTPCPCSGSIDFFSNEIETDIWAAVPAAVILAGDTLELNYITTFNTSTLNLTAGDSLRLETIVTFGNAGARGGSGASGINIDIDGSGTVESDEAFVRSVPTRSGFTLSAAVPCHGNVTLHDGRGDVTSSGPEVTVVTEVGHGSGVASINTSGVYHVWVSFDPQSEVNGIVTNCAHLSSVPTNLTVSVAGADDWNLTCCGDIANQDSDTRDCASFSISGGTGSPPNTSSSGLCTYTQGAWGAPPHGHNIAVTLHTMFATWYVNPLYLTTGIPSGYYLRLTSANAVETYLGTGGGTPGVLNANYVDPATTIPPRTFGHQVVTLQLNVDVFPAVGLLYYCSSGPSDVYYFFNNKTVNFILSWANTVLGAGPLPPTPSDTPPAYLTVSQMNDLVDSLNNAYDECVPDAFSAEFLHSGPCPALPPPPS